MEQLGRYELRSELGRGGMGIVYLAHDPLLDREVAIKVLPPDLAHDTGLVERFLDEGRNAARLTHPNIVKVFDVGVEAGHYYIAMEYVAGGSVGALLRARGTLPLEEAVGLLGPVAAALDEAHRHGIVHRDVKPENILLRPTGEPLLVDFGIARAGDSRGLTRTGMMLGTPLYMSPEQAAGQPVDERSDIYSLGVVGFHMLAGRPPFEAENDLGTALLHVSAAAPDVRQHRPDLAEPVAQTLVQAMAKDPQQRFATATDLVLSLSGHPPRRVEAPMALEAAPPVPRSRPTLTVVLAALAALVGVGLVATATASFWSAARHTVVPDVLGEQRDAAVMDLARAGLEGHVVLADHAGPANIVVGQVPIGGVGSSPGAVVELTVSRPAAPVPPPVPPAQDEILPPSDDRPLTDADLAGLSTEQLRIARNEVYARHGRQFTDPLYQQHFSKTSWYHPDPAYSDSRLSELELANAGRILRYQQTHSVGAVSSASGAASPYLLPQSATRRLTRDEVLRLSTWGRGMARNEIYARHGYVFKERKWADYFEQKSWYRPDPSFNPERLSSVEHWNADFLLSLKDLPRDVGNGDADGEG